MKRIDHYLKQPLLSKHSLLSKVSFLILAMILVASSTLLAQPDSIKVRLQAQQNAFNQPVDFPFDTVSPTVNQQTIDLNEVVFSKDSIDAPLIYDADDSMRMDVKNQMVYL